MALTKTRKIGKLINANRKFIAFDSDQISLTYSKGSTGTGGTGTTLVVATIDDLPLVTTEGNKALVSSTNTLYLYNNGWYKIAIVNNFNPQWITEPNSSYDLSINGAATIITVLASDSDDVPITYIADTDSDFDSIATVNHDSDKHNIWTIQPLDSENGAAVGGTGNVTFKASDGVNLVQSVSTFNLSFSYERFLWRYFVVTPSNHSSNLWDLQPNGVNSTGWYNGSTQVTTGITGVFGSTLGNGNWGVFASGANPLTGNTYNGGWDSGPLSGTLDYNVGGRTSVTLNTNMFIAVRFSSEVTDISKIYHRTYKGARADRIPNSANLQYYNGDLSDTYDDSLWVTYATLNHSQSLGHIRWDITEGGTITSVQA